MIIIQSSAKLLTHHILFTENRARINPIPEQKRMDLKYTRRSQGSLKSGRSPAHPGTHVQQDFCHLPWRHEH